MQEQITYTNILISGDTEIPFENMPREKPVEIANRLNMVALESLGKGTVIAKDKTA